jgi:hypothetical protein
MYQSRLVKGTEFNTLLLLRSMLGLEESLLERLLARPLYQPDRDRFLSHGGFDPFLVTKLIRNYRYRYRMSSVTVLCGCLLSVAAKKGHSLVFCLKLDLFDKIIHLAGCCECGILLALNCDSVMYLNIKLGTGW